MLYDHFFIQKLRARPPLAIALFEKGRPITCADVWENSLGLAQNLSKNGLREGQRVAIAAAPGSEFLYILYANILLRTTLAIIDPEMGRDNYQAKLRQFRPDWAFVDSRLLLLQEHPILRWLYFRTSKTAPYFPFVKGVKLVATGGWMPILKRHFRLANLLAPAAPPAGQKPLHPRLADGSGWDHGSPPPGGLGGADFLVTYTSGTLAEPKGVLHTLTSLAESIQLLGGLLKNDTVAVSRMATHLPHYFLIGINAGIESHCWDYKSAPAEKIDFIEKYGITTLFGPPSDYLPLLDFCEKTGRKLPISLSHLLFGSAPVHPAFLEKMAALAPAARLTCIYGMTENLLVCQTDGREKMKYAGPGDLVGQPFPSVELQIAPDGEVLLRSPQLFKKYLHLEARNGWHPTGDLGILNPDGSLALTGRKKDMLIRGNFNIYPGLYEPTINRIPGIREAVLIGVLTKKGTTSGSF